LTKAINNIECLIDIDIIRFEQYLQELRKHNTSCQSENESTMKKANKIMWNEDSLCDMCENEMIKNVNNRQIETKKEKMKQRKSKSQDEE